MQWIRANLPITLALALSVALHLFLVFPALGVFGGHWGGPEFDGTSDVADLESARADGSDERDPRDMSADKARAAQRSAENARRALQERRDLERRAPEELKEREDLVRLGIDDSKAVTMNWIGYAEYERHLAELAEVEQAAFRLQAASGSRGTASPLVPPAPPSTVAMSPSPSATDSPAAAAGSDSTPPANLVSQPTPQPASTQPGAPPLETAARTGADAELARPLPPPEATEQLRPNQSPSTPETPAQQTATSAPTSDERTGPQESPVGPSPTNETQPDASAVPDPTPQPTQPDNSARPAPPVENPVRTDPSAEPRDDQTTAPPAAIDPSRPRDPAPSGIAPNAEPRAESDPNATTAKPPIDAPRSPDQASAVSESTREQSTSNPAGDQSVSPAPGQRPAGAPGAQQSDGAQTTPTPPSPAGEPGDSQSKAGELSDRESDPTSTIEVPAALWRTGRPLAARGIELRPVRPQFLTLSRISGIARNPIGEIVLGRDGIPQVARIVRSSGNPGVDEAIRSALFKWRASGAPLAKLRPGQTVTIRLKLVMLED